MAQPTKPAKQTASGQMLVTFASGAVRKPSKWPRYDLVSPEGLRAWAEACSEGQETYGDLSYENTDLPVPQSSLIKAAIGHLYAYLSGSEEEKDLGHALWNIGTAVENDVRHPEANDLRRRVRVRR